MARLPLPTAKLNRRSTVASIRDAINACQVELMAEYDRSGKIGDAKPDMNDAWSVALKECYIDARRHAGDKVPKVEKLFPSVKKGR